jgi:hypothetical protein
MGETLLVTAVLSPIVTPFKIIAFTHIQTLFFTPNYNIPTTP